MIRKEVLITINKDKWGFTLVCWSGMWWR